MNQKILSFIPELQMDELGVIQNIAKDFTDSQLQAFANLYRVRRKDPQIIMLATLAGFMGVAGVQRFLVGQIGMGILYFFTGGLCLIGTIVDLINHKSLASDANRTAAFESAMLVKNMNVG